MSRRDKRVHGRILAVWEEQLGSSLSSDAAAGATTLFVEDVSAFNDDDEEPGGWLQVGDQVIEYSTVDDDACTIALATALTTAVTADGDQPEVWVWNDLYDEVDTIQWAQVMPDGKRDQADAIEAVVSETIEGLSNGDRGRPRESCLLERDGDEWELVKVKGRPSKSRGLKFEADDAYTLTAADITAGTATVPLSHRPIDESVKAVLGNVPQRPTEYTVNYDAQTITWPLSGFEKAGDVIWVHYAYRKGIDTPVASEFDAATVLLFHWKLDETGGTVFADSGPYNLPLDMWDSPTPGQPPAGALSGYSAAFAAGSAGYNSIFNEDVRSIIDNKPTMSWGFWFRSSETTGVQGLVTRDQANHTPALLDRHWGFYLNAGRVQAGIFNTAGTYAEVFTAAGWADGNWHRCWVTLGGGFLTVYVDGAQRAQMAWDFPTRDGIGKSICIGSGSLYNNPGTYAPMNGRLDDVIILGNTLPAEQVAAEWANGGIL